MLTHKQTCILRSSYINAVLYFIGLKYFFSIQLQYEITFDKLK